MNATSRVIGIVVGGLVVLSLLISWFVPYYVYPTDFPDHLRYGRMGTIPWESTGLTSFNESGVYKEYYCGYTKVVKVEHNLIPVGQGYYISFVTTDIGVYTVSGLQNPSSGTYVLFTGYIEHEGQFLGFKESYMQKVEVCPSAPQRLLIEKRTTWQDVFEGKGIFYSTHR